MSYTKPDSAGLSTLSNVPFEMIAKFLQIEKDKSLSRNQEYEAVEKAARDYIPMRNMKLQKGISVDMILDDDEWVHKMVDAYRIWKNIRDD
jgi:hypothetical protein